MAVRCAPIWMENLNRAHPSNVLDGESASSYSRKVQETSTKHDERTQPPQFSTANRNRSKRCVDYGELACPAVRRQTRAQRCQRDRKSTRLNSSHSQIS